MGRQVTSKGNGNNSASCMSDSGGIPSPLNIEKERICSAMPNNTASQQPANNAKKSTNRNAAAKNNHNKIKSDPSVNLAAKAASSLCESSLIDLVFSDDDEELPEASGFRRKRTIIKSDPSI